MEKSNNTKIRTSFTISEESERKLKEIMDYFETDKNLKLTRSVVVEKCIADVHDDIFLKNEDKEF